MVIPKLAGQSHCLTLVSVKEALVMTGTSLTGV